MGELLIAERQDLQDIANKLKAKTGKTDVMRFPNGFINAIDELGKGGSGGTNTSDATATASDILKDKTAYADDKKIIGTIETFDGSYECSSNSTGSKLQDKIITKNGIYTADIGYQGLGRVTVDIASDNATRIISNGSILFIENADTTQLSKNTIMIGG